MMVFIFITALCAMGWVDLGYSHVELSIPAFLYCIFAQAFVMFYFIGASRLVNNIWNILHEERSLEELFETAPEDITPYKEKTRKFVLESTRCKRQTIPWTMLVLVLGMLAFLFGGAHDTGLVEKSTHVGLVYGFMGASTIGFFRQWFYLGRIHRLLRKVKALFQLPDAQM